MRFTTVIFDMDGLLIDSEPLWAEAASVVFKDLGISLNDEQYAKTMGLRTREFVQHWFDHFDLPPEKLKVAETGIMDHVQELVRLKGKPMTGVAHILGFFTERKFRIGIASSSGLVLIEQVISQLGIGNQVHAICSAEHLPFGKPHPQVYLECAKKLGSAASECLCFEDSFNGMIAAKAARMACVVVPSAAQSQRPEWYAADLKLSSLQNFNELLLRSF